jgi:hypothetical protein
MFLNRGWCALESGEYFYALKKSRGRLWPLLNVFVPGILWVSKPMFQLRAQLHGTLVDYKGAKGKESLQLSLWRTY